MRSGLKRLAALGVDAALRVLPKPPVPGALVAPRVLVIRCDHIGDAVMATSVLGPLRRALSASRLDVLAGPWSEAIFRAHPDVDDVLTYATPWWLRARGAGWLGWMRAWAALPEAIGRIRTARYDCVVDLRGDLRHIVFFVATSRASERVSSDRTGGTRLLTRWSQYVPGRHEVDQDAAVVELLGAEGPFTPMLVTPVAGGSATKDLEAPYVVFALAGTEENRSWPVEHASEVADYLWRDHSLRTVIVGSGAEVARAQEIVRRATAPVTSLCGRTTIPELLGTIAAARAALVVDSGPMHAAAALGVPTVALFGPGNPAESAPRGRDAVVLGSGAPCGCVHPDCDYMRGPGRCMRELSPAMVISALAPLLAAS